MPRQARQYSTGYYYHIMLRGINRQNLFEDDNDRIRFIDTLFRFAEQAEGFKIAAWCLMSNHVHLLIGADRLPGQLIKKVGCSYVPYFNKKYGRVGHLFQDRYRSEAIMDERYLLTAARYIHMNPEKAGICQMEDYRWSSYRDYLSGDGKTDTALILDLLAGRDGFVEFMRQPDNTEFLEDTYSPSEKEAVSAAKDVLPEDFSVLLSCDRQMRNDYVRKLSARGLTPIQISRITGLAKSTVYNILK